MLVVLAGSRDRAARSLVARWSAYQARLVTCADLSVVGWRYYPGATEASTAVVGGRAVAAREIGGVLTRLPCVFEHELVRIVPAERAYVAAEMTAFLTSWLSGLRCPVLNRPTPTCLAGPNWRHEQWVYTAARVGIPVRPARRHAALSAGVAPEAPYPRPVVTVTVVGDRCIGRVTDDLASQARRLADVAGVDLLAVRFSGPEPGALFVGADPWPDVGTDAVADAVLEYLRGGSGR
jgi:hypothetical protein